MTVKGSSQGHETVWIVSHGPDCLDGVTCAVVLTKYLESQNTIVRFASNPEVSQAICALPLPAAPADQQLWITDISWSDLAAEDHLRSQAARGTSIFWIDHHQSAIERWERGAVQVPLAGRVLRDEFAASRLVYDYLRERVAGDEARTRLKEVELLVRLADDNDRWIHAHPGSRELALTVATMEGNDAYQELLRVGPDVAYTDKMKAAWSRVSRLLNESRAVASEGRREIRVKGVRLVTASCAGYASEIADEWGKEQPATVFAIFDSRSKGVSFRRSPDCGVNLAWLAERLGGGGHAAAAGCKLPGLTTSSAPEVLLHRVAPALEAVLAKRTDPSS